MIIMAAEVGVAVGAVGLLITITEKVIQLCKEKKLDEEGVLNTLATFRSFLGEVHSYAGFTESVYFKRRCWDCEKLLNNIEVLLKKLPCKKKFMIVTRNSIKKSVDELSQIKVELVDLSQILGKDVVSRTVQNEYGVQFWKEKFETAIEVDVSVFADYLETYAKRDPGLGMVLTKDGYKYFLNVTRDKPSVTLNRFNIFLNMVSANAVKIPELEDDSEQVFDSIGAAVDHLKEKKSLTTCLSHELESIHRFLSPGDSKSSGPSSPRPVEQHVANWMRQAVYLSEYFWGNEDWRSLEKKVEKKENTNGVYLLRYSSRLDGSAKLVCKLDGQVESFTLLCEKKKPDITEEEEKGLQA